MNDLKPIEPGDLVDVNARLREVMGLLEDGAYALNASFELLGETIEAEAVKMRHTLGLAANRVFSLIQMLESHPAYLAATKERDHD